MKYFLYSQPVKKFIQDIERIHDILKKAFEDEYGVPPGEDEFASWKKTLPLFAVTPKGHLHCFTADQELKPQADWIVIALVQDEEEVSG